MAQLVSLKWLLRNAEHVKLIYAPRHRWWAPKRGFCDVTLRFVFVLRKPTTLAVIILEWLKRIEPTSTTPYDLNIRSKSVHPLVSAETFPGGQRRNFAYPFQVADFAMRMEVHKTLYLFYPISLCWLNLNWEVELYGDKTIGQLLKLEHHTKAWKIEQMNYEHSLQKI